MTETEVPLMDSEAFDLLSEARAMSREITGWRRHLHENPELSFEEVEATEYLGKILEGLGLHPVRRTKTGLWADISGHADGPTILIRVDMDALPIQEEAAVSYRSRRSGIMHACGHDGHAAMGVGAAKLLMAHRASLPGRVRVLLQPAEEKLPGGAPQMIEAGVLDGVQEAVGLHLIPFVGQRLLRAGEVSVVEGAAMASPDSYRVVVRGVGGHGAMPHLARDPVPAAAAIVSTLQTIVSRNVSPVTPAVVTVGSIHGGEADNVIPPEVTMTGTVRTFDDATRSLAETAMRRVITETAAAFGVLAEFTYERGYPVLVNAPHATRAFQAVTGSLLGDEALVPGEPMMGGEDFAYILRKTPGVYFWLGCANEELGAVYANHDPRFMIDESALPVGSALLAATAMRLLAG